MSVFQFNPSTFQLVSRLYADRARWAGNLNRWVCEQGWERSFRGSAIQDFHPYDVSTFSMVSEPPDYFKKEVKQSLEMNYEQLSQYIHELQQSGFEVVKLRVQLQKKIAFPVITFVMGVLAIPFALSAGKRGTMAGVATAIVRGHGQYQSAPPDAGGVVAGYYFCAAGGYMILKVPT